MIGEGRGKVKPGNLDKIQQSFSVQAEAFENKKMNFSKQEYLDYTLMNVHVSKMDNVLEVAAGTCVCGRALAPFVSTVTCIDATPAMLEVGKREAMKQGMQNVSFVEGYVEALPFKEETFDVVITRLSFHHFTEVERPFSEMDRVLKKGGKLVIIDMEAVEETLRTTEDKIEMMRDFSHVKNRSKAEFVTLYEKYGYVLKKVESTEIPVVLSSWMKLTNTPEETQRKISGLMKADIIHQKLTGFSPYIKNGILYFNQRWLFMLGEKLK